MQNRYIDAWMKSAKGWQMVARQLHAEQRERLFARHVLDMAVAGTGTFLHPAQA